MWVGFINKITNWGFENWYLIMKIVHVLLLCLYATHIACQQPTVSVVGAGIGGAGIYQFS